METFMDGDETGVLVLNDRVARGMVIRSDATTGGSMLSDDEVLALAHSASLGIVRFGRACGLGGQASMIAKELQGLAKGGASGKSTSLLAYDVCRKALEV
jgi:hypothetical protein